MSAAENGRALDLLADLPALASGTGLDPTAWQDFAGILQLEGTLDGLSDHDARHVIALASLCVLEGTPEDVRSRGAWIRGSERARRPLEQPEACAVAFERIADLLELPIAGEPS